MTTQISHHAEAAREQARDSSGRFGVQPAAEASGVDLGGSPEPDARDTSNPLTPSFEATGQAFRDALAAYDSLDRDSWDERQEARYKVSSLAIQHAATEDGRADIAQRLEDHPEFAWDAPAWCDQGARRAAAIESHAQDGIGEGAVPISVAEARRRFPVGQGVEATYLGTAQRQPEVRVVTKQSQHEMVSARADGTEVHNGWSHRQAWEDQSGNIIVADEYGDPYVAYRQTDHTPVPPPADGSHPAAVPLNRVFAFQSGAPALNLKRVSMNGTDYITDRYTALRADHVRPQDGQEEVTQDRLSTARAFTKVAYQDTQPPFPDSMWSATVVGPLVKAGYEVRAAKQSPNESGSAAVHHIFRDGEHVGFTMDRSMVRGERKGVRFQDVPQMCESVSPGAAYSTWDKAHERFETVG